MSNPNSIFTLLKIYYWCLRMANNHVLVISIGFKLYSNLKQMRVFDSPGQDTNPSQVSSQQTLLLIYLYSERMESWVSLGGKECRTNIWFSAEPGIELCTLQLWLARRHLTNYTNHACQTVLQITKYLFSPHLIGSRLDILDCSHLSFSVSDFRCFRRQTMLPSGVQ